MCGGMRSSNRRGSAHQPGASPSGADAAVRRLAETIAEQRTLWALAQLREAILLFPASVGEQEARAALERALAAARRHHGWWMVVDAPLFVASGLAALIPGPNLLAYYLGFRLIGHWLSWRGARHAATSVQSDVRTRTAISPNSPRSCTCRARHAPHASMPLPRDSICIGSRRSSSASLPEICVLYSPSDSLSPVVT